MQQTSCNKSRAPKPAHWNLQYDNNVYLKPGKSNSYNSSTSTFTKIFGVDMQLGGRHGTNMHETWAGNTSDTRVAGKQAGN